MVHIPQHIVNMDGYIKSIAGVQEWINSLPFEDDGNYTLSMTANHSSRDMTMLGSSYAVNKSRVTFYITLERCATYTVKEVFTASFIDGVQTSSTYTATSTDGSSSKGTYSGSFPALIGNGSPELVTLPKGSEVYPSPDAPRWILPPKYAESDITPMETTTPEPLHGQGVEVHIDNDALRTAFTDASKWKLSLNTSTKDLLCAPSGMRLDISPDGTKWVVGEGDASADAVRMAALAKAQEKEKSELEKFHEDLLKTMREEPQETKCNDDEEEDYYDQVWR